MEPLQYHLRLLVAKDKRATQAAAPARNPDTTIPMRSAPRSGKPARMYVYGNATWQQSSSNYNTIFDRKLHKTLEMQCAGTCEPHRNNQLIFDKNLSRSGILPKEVACNICAAIALRSAPPSG